MFIDYLYKQVFTDIMERKNRKKNDFQIFMWSSEKLDIYQMCSYSGNGFIYWMPK